MLLAAGLLVTGPGGAAHTSVQAAGATVGVPAAQSVRSGATAPAGDADPAVVTLLDVSPLVLTSADTLVLSGTVTSRSAEPLTNLNTYLRLSRVATTDRDELDRLTAPDYRGGFRPGPFAPLGDALQPAQSLPFRLEVSALDLGLTAPGVYPIGVEILAGFENGSRGVAGRASTVVPWLPPGDAGSEVAVDLALAVPLTAPVDRAADGSYLSDQLGELLAPTGALGELLADGVRVGAGDGLVAEGPLGAVTWLLDPALLEAAADMADGYDLRTDPVDPAVVEAGAHAGDAAAWLERLSPYVRSGSVRLLSYGHVDVVALVRAGMGADVTAALQSAPDAAAAALGISGTQLPGRADLGAPFYPPAGVVDEAALQVLAAAGVRSLLLADEGLAADAGPVDGTAAAGELAAGELADRTLALQGAAAPVVELGGTELTAVRADSTLGALLSHPQDVINSRQLALAHTALAALDAQRLRATGRLVVVAPASMPAAGLPALHVLAGAAPWVRPVPLPDGGTAAGAAASVRYPDAAGATELAPAYVRQLAALDATMRTFSSLSGDQAGAAELDRARLRAASAGWRTQPERAAALVAAEATALGEALGRVRIVTTGTVTLSSDSGRFPLTVANDLDQPVTVRLGLSSRTPARLHTSAPELVEIAAGAKTTVEVSAQATSNGVYVVDARLQTADGAAFGAPVAVTLRATQYDTVAWVVMAAAAGLIFVGSGLRVARRMRTYRREVA